MSPSPQSRRGSESSQGSASSQDTKLNKRGSTKSSNESLHSVTSDASVESITDLDTGKSVRRASSSSNTAEFTLPPLASSVSKATSSVKAIKTNVSSEPFPALSQSAPVSRESSRPGSASSQASLEGAPDIAPKQSPAGSRPSSAGSVASLPSSVLGAAKNPSADQSLVGSGPSSAEAVLQGDSGESEQKKKKKKEKKENLKEKVEAVQGNVPPTLRSNIVYTASDLTQAEGQNRFGEQDLSVTRTPMAPINSSARANSSSEQGASKVSKSSSRSLEASSSDGGNSDPSVGSYSDLPDGGSFSHSGHQGFAATSTPAAPRGRLESRLTHVRRDSNASESSSVSDVEGEESFVHDPKASETPVRRLARPATSSPSKRSSGDVSALQSQLYINQDENEKLREKIEALEGELARLREEKSKLDQTLHDQKLAAEQAGVNKTHLEDFERKNEDLHRQIEGLKEAKTDLERRLTESEKVAQALRGNLGEKDGEIERRNSELERVNSQNRKLKQENKDQKEVIDNETTEINKLRKTNDGLLNDKERLESANLALVGENKVLAQELAKKDFQIKDLEAEKLVAQQEYDDADKALRSQIEELEHQIKQNNRLASNNSRLSQGPESPTASSRSVPSLDEEMNAAKSKEDKTLQGKIADLEEQKRALEGKLREMESQEKHKERELDVEIQKLKSERDVYLLKVREALAKLEGHVSAFEEKAAISSPYVISTKEDDRINSLRGRVLALQNKFDEKSQELAKQVEENNKLKQSKKDDRKGFTDALVKKEKELQESQRANLVLQQQIATLQARIAELQKNAAINQQDKDKNEARITELTKQLADLQAQKAKSDQDIAAKQGEIEQLKALIAKKEEGEQRQASELAALRTEIEGLEGEKSNLSLRLQELTNQADQKAADIERLKAESGEKDNKIAEQEARLQRKDALLLQQTNVIGQQTRGMEDQARIKASLEQNLQSKDEEIARIKEELEQLKQQKSGVEGQLSELQKSLETKTAEVQSKQSEIERLMAELAAKAQEYQNKLSEIAGQNDGAAKALKQEMQSIQAQKDALSAEKDALSAQIGRSAAELNRISGLLSGAEEELRREKQEFEQKKVDFERRLAKSEGEKEGIAAELVGSERANAGLRQEIQNLTERARASENRLREEQGERESSDRELYQQNERLQEENTQLQEDKANAEAAKINAAKRIKELLASQNGLNQQYRDLLAEHGALKARVIEVSQLGNSGRAAVAEAASASASSVPNSPKRGKKRNFFGRVFDATARGLGIARSKSDPSIADASSAEPTNAIQQRTANERRASLPESGDAAANDRQRLDDALGDIKRRLQQSKEDAERLAALEAERARIANQLAGVQNQLAQNQRNQDGQAANNAATIASLKRQLEQKENEINELKIQNEAAWSRLKGDNDFLKEVGGRKLQELETANAANQQLQNQVAELQRQLQAAERAKGEGEAQKANEIAQLNERLQFLQQQKDESDREVVRINAELAALTEVLNRQSANIDSQQQASNTLERVFNEQSEAMRLLSAEKLALSTKIDELEQLLTEKEARLVQNQANLDEVLARQRDAFAAEKATLENRLAASEQERRRIEAEKTESNRLLSDATVSLQEVREVLEQKNQETEHAKALARSAQEQSAANSAAAAERNRILEARNQALETELAQARNDFAALQSQAQQGDQSSERSSVSGEERSGKAKRGVFSKLFGRKKSPDLRDGNDEESKRQIAELRDRITDLEKELTNSRQAAEAARQENEQLQLDLQHQQNAAVFGEDVDIRKVLVLNQMKALERERFLDRDGGGLVTRSEHDGGAVLFEVRDGNLGAIGVVIDGNGEINVTIRNQQQGDVDSLPQNSQEEAQILTALETRLAEINIANTSGVAQLQRDNSDLQDENAHLQNLLRQMQAQIDAMPPMPARTRVLERGGEFGGETLVDDDPSSQTAISSAPEDSTSVSGASDGSSIAGDSDLGAPGSSPKSGSGRYDAGGVGAIRPKVSLGNAAVSQNTGVAKKPTSAKNPPAESLSLAGSQSSQFDSVLDPALDPTMNDELTQAVAMVFRYQSDGSDGFVTQKGKEVDSNTLSQNKRDFAKSLRSGWEKIQRGIGEGNYTQPTDFLTNTKIPVWNWANWRTLLVSDIDRDGKKGKFNDSILGRIYNEIPEAKPLVERLDQLLQNQDIKNILQSGELSRLGGVSDEFHCIINGTKDGNGTKGELGLRQLVENHNSKVLEPNEFIAVIAFGGALNGKQDEWQQPNQSDDGKAPIDYLHTDEFFEDKRRLHNAQGGQLLSMLDQAIGGDPQQTANQMIVFADSIRPSSSPSVSRQRQNSASQLSSSSSQSSSLISF